jgi:phosphoglycerate dehydrogenase-like enzyme
MTRLLTVLASWAALPAERELVTSMWRGCEILFASDFSRQELEARAPSVDVIVAGKLPLWTAVAATNLKFVHVLGHGIDQFCDDDVRQLLLERRTPIVRANPAAIPIAEFVIMSMIALNRRLIRQHEALAYRGDWSKDLMRDRLEGSMGGELSGSTLCIVGLGSIGMAIAERARAMGMKVGALTRDPARHANASLDFVGGLSQPDEWLARSKHIVLALPLTGSTQNFLDAERLSRLPRGGFLVNVGRSGLVDHSALYAALASGQLAGAAIDVWDDEQAKGYPSRYPLHQFNVVMTPHSTALTREARLRAFGTVGESIARFAAGGQLDMDYF